MLDLGVEDLVDLGVNSSVHQMKIVQLFRRELQGTKPKYSLDHLCQFLKENKLGQYIEHVKDHVIDGDMVLNVEESVMKKVLKEIGVTRAVDTTRICSKYKTFCK